MNYKELLNIIIDNKNKIAGIVLVSLMISIVYAFFIATPYYKSISTIYQKKESSMTSSGLSDFKSGRPLQIWPFRKAAFKSGPFRFQIWQTG